MKLLQAIRLLSVCVGIQAAHSQVKVVRLDPPQIALSLDQDYAIGEKIPIPLFPDYDLDVVGIKDVRNASNAFWIGKFAGTQKLLIQK